MTDHTLTEQQLEELRPLAAVIEGAIQDTPIRLGTDDWGTMLAAGILVRVAAYMGGIVPPVTDPGDWLTRGTRDLSIPEQVRPADGPHCVCGDPIEQTGDPARWVHRPTPGKPALDAHTIRPAIDRCAHRGPHPSFTCAEVNQTRPYWDVRWDAEQQAPATEEDGPYLLRVLTDRAARGVLSLPGEGESLRRRVEQLINGRATWKAKAEEIERDRDRIATDRDAADRIRAEVQRDRDQHAAVLREVLAAFVSYVPGYRIPRRSAEVDVVTLEKWRSVVASTAEQPWWEQLAGMRAELEQVRGHLRYVLDYQGPAHEHQVPGRWDRDGSLCDHCARLASARAALVGAERQPDDTGRLIAEYQAAILRVLALRQPIAEALEQADYRMDMRRGDLADAVMPVIRAAVDGTAQPTTEA